MSKKNMEAFKNFFQGVMFEYHRLIMRLTVNGRHHSKWMKHYHEACKLLNEMYSKTE